MQPTGFLPWSVSMYRDLLVLIPERRLRNLPPKVSFLNIASSIDRLHPLNFAPKYFHGEPRHA